MGDSDDEGSTSREKDVDDISTLSSLSDLTEEVGTDERDDGQETAETASSLSDLADLIEQRQSGKANASSTERDRTDESSVWDLVDQDESATANQTTNAKTEALLDLVKGSSNILIKGPEDHVSEDNLCSRLMMPRPQESMNILLILVEQTPRQRLSILENYLSGDVNNISIIDIHTYNKGRDSDSTKNQIEEYTVSSPTDLRRIGILASKILSDWEEAGQTAICIHSLSDFIEAAENKSNLFRFVHILRGRVRTTNSRAHYHVHPDKHDPQTLQTFTQLFDTELQYDMNGNVSLN